MLKKISMGLLALSIMSIMIMGSFAASSNTECPSSHLDINNNIHDIIVGRLNATNTTTTTTVKLGEIFYIPITGFDIKRVYNDKFLENLGIYEVNASEGVGFPKDKLGWTLNAMKFKAMKTGTTEVITEYQSPGSSGISTNKYIITIN